MPYLHDYSSREDTPFFLKQQWLAAQTHSIGTSSGAILTLANGSPLSVVTVSTVVEMGRWNDGSPRVTKDFDFIVALELIASEETQEKLSAVLSRHRFQVVPQNARWQFVKKVTSAQEVLLDFHAPSPTEAWDNLRVEKRRVKPGRSLNSTGIHGRENREANATELHPFTFTQQGVEVATPHPIPFSIIKLVAMGDRWRAASEGNKTEGERHAERSQAVKHAEDLMRIVAMTTRSEMDLADEILGNVRETPPFLAATKICSDSVLADGGWAAVSTARSWQRDDFELIRAVLGRWFTRSTPPR